MKILVADDDPTILRILVVLLTKWGYDVTAASNGKEAWDILGADDPPKIALIDWVMPKIDGLELCRKIKDPENAMPFIYVILLTGKTSKQEIVEGLDAGADDYIGKPIEKSQLKSRLAVGMRAMEYEISLSEINLVLKEKNKALSKFARIMGELAEERAAQLVHAERLSTLGELSAGIAHEMNNYITPVSGYLDLIMLKLSSTHLDEDIRKDLMDCIVQGKIGVEKIKRLLRRTRELARISETKSSENINNIALSAIELCQNRLRYLTFQKKLAENMPKITVNAQEIEQVLVNLLKNASDELQRNGTIKLSTSFDNESVMLQIEDNGPGVREDCLESIFEAFYSTKDISRGTGLGLSICKGIIENHNGTITAKNAKNGGAIFQIKLPIDPSAKKISEI